jgi:hypothetical protein
MQSSGGGRSTARVRYAYSRQDDESEEVNVGRCAVRRIAAATADRLGGQEVYEHSRRNMKVSRPPSVSVGS